MLTLVGDRCAADGPVLHVLAAELAPAEDQGVVFGVIQVAAELDHSTRQTCSPTGVRRLPLVPGEREHLPDHAARMADSAAWSPSPGASARRLRNSSGRIELAPLSKIAGIRVIPLDPSAAARRRKLPGRFRDRLARRSRSRSVGFANKIVQKAMASGMFIFADTDVKFDQPQTEVVFDRDKLRSQGVDLSQAGQDLSTMLGGNYVNRFSIQGRSYKVIPQVKRAERLTPEQLSQIYVKGSAEQAGAALDLRHPEDHDRAALAEQISAAECSANSGRDSAAAFRSTRR